MLDRDLVLDLGAISPALTLILTLPLTLTLTRTLTLTLTLPLTLTLAPTLTLTLTLTLTRHHLAHAALQRHGAGFGLHWTSSGRNHVQRHQDHHRG